MFCEFIPCINPWGYIWGRLYTVLHLHQGFGGPIYRWARGGGGGGVEGNSQKTKQYFVYYFPQKLCGIIFLINALLPFILVLIVSARFR